VRNTLEEITLEERTGTLDRGKYILLRYTDPPWSLSTTSLKVINEDLLIGRCTSALPKGRRLFTFPMTRLYGLDSLTVDDHHAFYQGGSAPPRNSSTALGDAGGGHSRDTGVVAYLKFDLKPDGRLEAPLPFHGIAGREWSSLSLPPDHFQMNDFTPFHDEIRFVDKDFIVGKIHHCIAPGLWQLFGPGSLAGLFPPGGPALDGTPQFWLLLYPAPAARARQTNSGHQFSPAAAGHPAPDGLGMTFDEEMVGFYFPGLSLPPGREGDLGIRGQNSFIRNPAGSSRLQLPGAHDHP